MAPELRRRFTTGNPDEVDKEIQASEWTLVFKKPFDIDDFFKQIKGLLESRTTTGRGLSGVIRRAPWLLIVLTMGLFLWGAVKVSARPVVELLQGPASGVMSQIDTQEQIIAHEQGQWGGPIVTGVKQVLVTEEVIREQVQRGKWQLQPPSAGAVPGNQLVVEKKRGTVIATLDADGFILSVNKQQHYETPPIQLLPHWLQPVVWQKEKKEFYVKKTPAAQKGSPTLTLPPSALRPHLYERLTALRLRETLHQMLTLWYYPGGMLEANDKMPSQTSMGFGVWRNPVDHSILIIPPVGIPPEWDKAIRVRVRSGAAPSNEMVIGVTSKNHLMVTIREGAGSETGKPKDAILLISPAGHLGYKFDPKGAFDIEFLKPHVQGQRLHLERTPLGGQVLLEVLLALTIGFGGVGLLAFAAWPSLISLSVDERAGLPSQVRRNPPSNPGLESVLEVFYPASGEDLVRPQFLDTIIGLCPNVKQLVGVDPAYVMVRGIKVGSQLPSSQKEGQLHVTTWPHGLSLGTVQQVEKGIFEQHQVHRNLTLTLRFIAADYRDVTRATLPMAVLSPTLLGLEVVTMVVQGPMLPTPAGLKFAPFSDNDDIVYRKISRVTEGEFARVSRLDQDLYRDLFTLSFLWDGEKFSSRWKSDPHIGKLTGLERETTLAWLDRITLPPEASLSKEKLQQRVQTFRAVLESSGLDPSPKEPRTPPLGILMLTTNFWPMLFDNSFAWWIVVMVTFLAWVKQSTTLRQALLENGLSLSPNDPMSLGNGVIPPIWLKEIGKVSKRIPKEETDPPRGETGTHGKRSDAAPFVERLQDVFDKRQFVRLNT